MELSKHNKNYKKHNIRIATAHHSLEPKPELHTDQEPYNYHSTIHQIKKKITNTKPNPQILHLFHLLHHNNNIIHLLFDPHRSNKSFSDSPNNQTNETQNQDRQSHT